MQWHRTLAALVLLAIAAVLAAANVWFAALRSTIPMQLDSVVAGKLVRHEKHPPKDDVCLLDLGQLGVIHVDRKVFDRVAMNAQLRKSQWSGILLVNEEPTALEYSTDTQGMVRAMPLVCLISLGTAAGAAALAAACQAEWTGQLHHRRSPSRLGFGNLRRPQQILYVGTLFAHFVDRALFLPGLPGASHALANHRAHIHRAKTHLELTILGLCPVTT